MKSRKGCVVGTSIHKDKSSEGSPMNFLGRRKAAPVGTQDPKQEIAMEGGVDPAATQQATGGAGGGRGRGIANALLNPAGAIADKMGMGDTTLGKVLNPLGGLFGRK